LANLLVEENCHPSCLQAVLWPLTEILLCPTLIDTIWPHPMPWPLCLLDAVQKGEQPVDTMEPFKIVSDMAKRYLKIDIAPTSLMCRAISTSPLKEPVVVEAVGKVRTGDLLNVQTPNTMQGSS
jgi:hypothetical protein